MRTMNSQLRDVAAPGGRTETSTIVMSPHDAQTRGITVGDQAKVESEFGVTIGEVAVDEKMQPGSIGMPHGWSAPDVGRLTSADSGIDPLTGMVLQSGLSVSVEKLPN
jgi:anaerobic selenocysteine-containing dehydrogenase